ncbi:MAG: nitroreductase family protein [Desulfocapsaceae bacterium]|nr:nitroreductase family protein [Desulfocapsaceae bacterium]
MRNVLEVNNETCIGCGECAQDCPYGLILMQNDRPAMDMERVEMCLECHHCLAVCPTGALCIHGCNPDDSQALPGNSPSAEQLSLLIKGRRTTRRYRKEPVSREEIDFLLEAVAYAPTAVNNRQVLFTIIEDPQVMDNFRKATYAMLQEKIMNGGLPAGMEYLQEAVVKSRDSGQDIIFRGAPHFIIASAPKTGSSPEADCHIALSYFELMAASMGLGTVWSGLAKRSLAMLTPESLYKLGIPESHTIGYMMAFGRPAVIYHRTVQRENCHINRVLNVA